MIKASLFRLAQWSDELNKRTIVPCEGARSRTFKNRQQMAAENNKLRNLNRNYQLWVEESKLSSYNIL